MARAENRLHVARGAPLSASRQQAGGYTTGPSAWTERCEHDARLLVRGGRRLEGEITLSGAKNSALKLLAASLLTDEPCVIRRVPRITDVATMVDHAARPGRRCAASDDGELRVTPAAR